MKLSLIAAIDRNWTIGIAGKLPWRLASDMVHFRRCTLDKPVIMGRKTWESLVQRPLWRRTNIVMSRRTSFRAKDTKVVGSIEEALGVARASGAEEAFVIGGASVYRAAIPWADRLVLTHVETQVEGDTYFPRVDLAAWCGEEIECVKPSERDEYGFRVVVYTRN